MIFIGMDDTDNHESRGTGRLARTVAANLPGAYRLAGVTRHQLLVDERVPMTMHNSSAAICIDGGERENLEHVFALVKEMMQADFQPGSDPGLCVADGQVAKKLVDFGRKAQQEIVKQSEARRLAEETGVLLEGLGGTQDGVIGAIAAVGLAAGGDDGRYILVGQLRELVGMQPVQAILAAGIAEVCKMDGSPVRDGMILTDKMRPARRGARAVQYVEWAQEYWKPVRLD